MIDKNHKIYILVIKFMKLFVLSSLCFMTLCLVVFSIVVNVYLGPLQKLRTAFQLEENGACQHDR